MGPVWILMSYLGSVGSLSLSLLRIIILQSIITLIYKANSLKKKDYQVMMMLYLMLYFARKWFLAIVYNLMSLVCVIFKLMSTFNLV